MDNLETLEGRILKLEQENKLLRKCFRWLFYASKTNEIAKLVPDFVNEVLYNYE